METIVSLIYGNLGLYVLVFVRTAGMIGLNPVMSKKGVPVSVRTALVFCVTILLASSVPAGSSASLDSFDFFIALIKELAIGCTLGYVYNIFFYMLMTAFDFMDMQIGLTMAKVLDPNTNVQQAFTGNFLSSVFVAYVFATDSHLLLIRLALYSYDIIPAGAEVFMYEEVIKYMLNIFSSAFMLAIRLSFPFIAIEFVLEMCLGLLMKLVPQVHIFVVNMQLKIITGLLLFFLMTSQITVFIDNYITVIFENMQNVLLKIAGQ